MEYSALSETALVSLLQTGDQLAFNEIYGRFHRQLYIYARKVMHEAKEAEDVVQELFVSLWDKREVLEIKTSLAAYLYSGVRYKFIDLVSRQKVRADYAASFQAFMEQGRNATDEYIQGKELASLVEKEVIDFSGKMREVFELSRASGLSHREIASQMNISEKTVRNHINHALRVLRLKLAFYKS